MPRGVSGFSCRNACLSMQPGLLGSYRSPLELAVGSGATKDNVDMRIIQLPSTAPQKVRNALLLRWQRDEAGLRTLRLKSECRYGELGSRLLSNLVAVQLLLYLLVSPSQAPSAPVHRNRLRADCVVSMRMFLEPWTHMKLQTSRDSNPQRQKLSVPMHSSWPLDLVQCIQGEDLARSFW